MLDSYRKMILLLILISSVFLSVINYYEVSELTKYPTFNNISISTNSVYDDVLINYTGFKFLINPRICKRKHLELFLIVTVPSYIGNYDYRRSIRHTWGRWDNSVKVVFFVGIPDSDIENDTRRIRMESDTYGDIVQGNVVEGYKNLSYKHVMILKWVAQQCTHAQFVLKVDDDVVVDLYRLYGLLEEYRWGRNDVMACFPQSNATVMRNLRGWVVPSQYYVKQYYPPYCSGYTIVYSLDVVLRLLEASRRVPYFFIEDVYVTGFLAKEASITMTKFDVPALNEELGNLLISNPSRLLGEGPYVFGPYFTTWRKMQKFWIPLQRYNFKIEKLNRKRNVTFYTVIPVG